MKALYYTQYGSPEVLQVKELPKPVPKDNEVLVKIHAASINSWDWDVIRGKPWIIRLWGFSKPKYNIPGCDIAGVVESVGKEVRKFKPGDEVFGDLNESKFGAFAEYKCALEKSLELKSPAMSFEEAAAVPQAAMLAVQALRDKLPVSPGKTLLIKGAGGGVGSFTIQLGKLYGLEVTGVDSAEKFDMMSQLGCDHVIDYRKVDFTRTGKKYDFILDVNTDRSLLDFARALNRDGIYVSVGGSMGRLFQALIYKPWVAGFGKKYFRFVMMKTNQDLAYMNELFEAGKLKVWITGPYKLEEAVQAFRAFSQAKFTGKIVVTI